MAENSKIEWTDASWQTITAAKRIGISPQEYVEKVNSGLKWCTACKEWHERTLFGTDRSRGDSLTANCLNSKRIVQRRINFGGGRRGWLTAPRAGDKKQARRRVNYLVEQGIIPRPDDLPCMDCCDEVFVGDYRHEYDHPRGYDGPAQLDVEPVCSRCHHNREEARRGQAA